MPQQQHIASMKTGDALPCLDLQMPGGGDHRPIRGMHQVPAICCESVLDELLQRRQIAEVKYVTGEVHDFDTLWIVVPIRTVAAVRRCEHGHSMTGTSGRCGQTPAVATHAPRIRWEFVSQHQNALARAHRALTRPSGDV
jgi:hypothetical protein